MAGVLAVGDRSFLSHTPSGQLAGIVNRRDLATRTLPLTETRSWLEDLLVSQV